MDDLLFALTLIAALGSGLIAGAFFAFSTFVMKALARLPSREGIAAMQAINIVVINPGFLGVFVGTAAASALAALLALPRWQSPGGLFVLLGGALYLLGCFGVTVAFHVPRNNALADAAPDDPGSARLWARYVAEWTAGNHVRTLAALAASAAFILALAFR